jgi:hypothetical protein
VNGASAVGVDVAGPWLGCEDHTASGAIPAKPLCVVGGSSLLLNRHIWPASAGQAARHTHVGKDNIFNEA